MNAHSSGRSDVNSSTKPSMLVLCLAYVVGTWNCIQQTVTLNNVRDLEESPGSKHEKYNIKIS